ncbi:MAG TPA: hypothetical protein VHB77_18775 [Planctomycetaceae bacterium]|nr:hypothetical protein [Planctomycetaceae bacterium]
MDLVCGACGAPFKSEDLDLRRGVATCRYCHAVTQLQTAQVQTPAAPAAVQPSIPQFVPQPDSVHVDEWQNELVLTRRWFTPVLFFLAFFCVAWDSFLIFWYWMGLTNMGDMGPMRLIFLIFPICHVAVGVGLTYTTVAGFFNRTIIRVNRNELTIWHGPIPWAGNRTLSVESIRQLYTRVGVPSANQQNVQANFQVYVLLANGRSEKLLWLPDVQQAEFIRQKIENFIGLEHQPVAGEVGAIS